MGKLFCTVLNTRLAMYMKNNNIGNKFQIGFSENCRTSDHILTLKTLFDKYSQSNKKLYTCFVDFRKAFDTVWRDALLYKMINLGIGGTFAKLIETMYMNTHVQIKLNAGLTEAFNDNIGVKQGCVLSPTLFKLFVSDLPKVFHEKCMPASLGKENISCLMFADDVVIISETKEGLQESLHCIAHYSEKWRLKINTDKTKVMVFNKNGKMTCDNFLLGEKALETVKTYTYLGIEFNNCGSFNNAMLTLSQKATKAMFKLRSCIYQANLSPNTCLYLFDAMIRPICTYGSDVWGAFLKNIGKMFDINSNKYSYFNDNSAEKVDLKFIKSVLGVHKKSSNPACQGELGRYPIVIFILKQVLKNWLRISNYDTSSILYDTYICNIEMMKENKTCWLSHVKNVVVDTLGLSHLWENQGSVSKQMNTKLVCKAVRNLKTIYEFQWRNEINKHTESNLAKSNKLRVYCKFKKEFVYEPYLNFTKDFHKRKYITRLRISAHRLEIECGRYKKVEERHRLCKNCTTNLIENEEHVLMVCPKYADSRKIMLDTIIEIYPHLRIANTENIFLFIMKCEDPEIFNGLANMIQDIIALRGDF
jgi:hypothetical protein